VKYSAVKRAVDVVVSAGLLVATLPLQAGVATVVAATQGRPVLYRQRRPGKAGRLFVMRKFRTMRHESYPGEPDADRLNGVGRFLRATSLDELPELWNVLVGDMSLVGPRPLLEQYLPLYSEEQARRHEVRPGITGLAQVSGRNALSWEEKFAYDVRYVDELSWRTDFDILVRTVSAVLKREGISADGHVTMRPFTGSATA